MGELAQLEFFIFFTHLFKLFSLIPNLSAITET